MATRWHRTFSSWKRPAAEAIRCEAGITLTELMIAVVLMSVVFVGMLAYFQLAMAANLKVNAQASYSQELSLTASQILDGAGGRYRGLRQASAVHTVYGPDHTSYTFTYSGLDAAHSETYWSDRGKIYRTRGTGVPEEVGTASGLQIAAVGGAATGVYSIVVTGGTGTVSGTDYVTYVRLRNCPP